MYRRYSRFKRYKKIDAELHRLTSRTHDYLFELRIANNHGEYDMAAALATKNALTAASNIFTTLLATPCTASLMLVANGRLTTSLYCHNVDPQREANPSSGLDPGHGVAGQAFGTREPVIWTVEDKTFRDIRKDHRKFYLSGISVPFKVGGEYFGLLNIDCKLRALIRKRTRSWRVGR
jgi:transcriptional regulator with GAF, ATPase, and Fis domain